jgi:O-antigen/teichoic acid export membrane protein
MLKHVIKLLASDVIAKGANFLLGIYLVRSLSAENYGIYQYVLAILGYYTAIGSFGLDNYALKQSVQAPDSAKFAGEIIAVKLMLSAAAALVYFPVALSLLENPLVFVVAYFNVVATILSLDWLLYVHRRSSLLSIGKLLAVCVKAGVLIVGLHVANNAYAPLIADAVFSAIPLSLYSINCLKQNRIKLTWPQFLTIKHHLLQSRHFFYFLLVNTFIASSDFILLKHMLNYEAVARYGIAYMYVPLTNNALAIVVNLYVPRIGGAEADLRPLLKSYFRYIIAFIAILWIFATIFGHFFFTIVYTEKYADVVTTFYWMMVVASLQAVQTYIISVLNARNLIHINFRIGCFGALSNIAANLILIPAYDINGAAFAMLISNALMITLAYVPFRRVIRRA